MKKRRVKFDFFSAILFIIFLLNENMFYLISYTSICQPMMVIFLILLILVSNSIIISKKNATIFRFACFYFILASVSFLYTVIGGLQSFSQAMIKYMPFFNILICVPFIGNKIYRKDKFIDVFNAVSITVSIVYIIQILIYPRMIFLHSIAYRNGARIINGGLMLLISFLILLNSYYQNKKNLFTLIEVFIIGYNIIFINQSRSLILSMTISGGVYFITRGFSSLKKIKAATRKLIIASIVSMLLIWLFIYIKELFLNSYSIKESSSVNRLAAYEYYISLFLEHPFLGIGMIRNQLSDGFAQTGVASRLFIDDIGIVGFIAQWGIMGIIVFGYWIGIIIKNLYRNRNPLSWALFAAVVAILPFNIFLNMNYGIIYAMFVLIIVCRSNSELS